MSWESDIYLKMVNLVDWLPRGGPGGVNCHTTNNHLALIRLILLTVYSSAHEKVS